MRRWLPTLLATVLASAAWSAAWAEAPSPGTDAPAFELPGSDGKTHSLAEHVGKEGVVLAWFPKAFTPG